MNLFRSARLHRPNQIFLSQFRRLQVLSGQQASNIGAPHSWIRGILKHSLLSTTKQSANIEYGRILK